MQWTAEIDKAVETKDEILVTSYTKAT